MTQGLSAVLCEEELPGIAAVKDKFSSASPRLKKLMSKSVEM